MKEQLVFDTTDATTIEHSDKVGSVTIGVDGSGDHQLIAAISADVQRLAVDAALRAADGTALTSTGGALDVNLASPISIDVDLDHTNDSVRLGDGTTLTTVTAGIGDDVGKSGLDVNIINPRLLDYLDDSVTVHQAGTVTVDGTVNAVQSGVWDIGTVTTLTGITNDVNIADGGNSITVDDGGLALTVDAVDLDIRDLDHLQDSVKIGDGVEFMAVNADGSINVNMINDINVSDAALADTAIATAANTLDVANTAEDVVASPLADRKYLHIMNMDNKRVYIGQSGVTAASGYPLSPKASIMLRAGAAVDIEFVGSSGAEIRTLELS